MIILVGGEKGGTGKTTIATNIAAMMAKRGRDVLLVDTDTQGSASLWAAARSEIEGAPKITCIQKHGRSVSKEIESLSSKFDDIVIDSGGRDSIELRSAMMAADIMLIPGRPSTFDIHSLALMNSLVEQSRALVNPDLQAFVVINGAPTHASSSDAADMREAVEDLSELKMMTAVLRDRVGFRRAAGRGLSIVEHEADTKSVAEVQALFDEILSLGKETA